MVAKAAAVAAGLALLAAALGPLPATGFADHPLVDFGRTVAEHVGVREAAPPAIPPGEPLTVAGRDVTAAEASSAARGGGGGAGGAGRLRAAGVAVLRGGADGGQLRRLRADVRRPEGASVVLYQERASGADLAAGAASATDVALVDGTAATYVRGAWQAADGQTETPALTWNADAGQTLVFERGRPAHDGAVHGSSGDGALAVRAGG